MACSRCAKEGFLRVSERSPLSQRHNPRKGIRSGLTATSSRPAASCLAPTAIDSTLPASHLRPAEGHLPPLGTLAGWSASSAAGTVSSAQGPHHRRQGTRHERQRSHHRRQRTLHRRQKTHHRRAGTQLSAQGTHLRRQLQRPQSGRR